MRWSLEQIGGKKSAKKKSTWKPVPEGFTTRPGLLREAQAISPGIWPVKVRRFVDRSFKRALTDSAEMEKWYGVYVEVHGRRRRMVFPKAVGEEFLLREKYLMPPQVLRRLLELGIPVSKKGLDKWLERRAKNQPSEAEKRFVQEPIVRGRRLSPELVKEIEEWAASLHTARFMAMCGALVPIPAIAQEVKKTPNGVRIQTRGAHITVGDEAFVSPALAEQLRAHFQKRGKIVKVPSAREQNESVATIWINRPATNWGTAQKDLAWRMMKADFDKPFEHFIKKTIPRSYLLFLKW